MTIYEFRDLLAAELDAMADEAAIANGSSMSRDLGEYRAGAGRAAGVRMAADVTREFLKRDDEDDDDE